MSIRPQAYFDQLASRFDKYFEGEPCIQSTMIIGSRAENGDDLYSDLNYYLACDNPEALGTSLEKTFGDALLILKHKDAFDLYFSPGQTVIPDILRVNIVLSPSPARILSIDSALEKNNMYETSDISFQVSSFLSHFELLSRQHMTGDNYLFYYYQQQALHDLVSMLDVIYCKKPSALPKRMVKTMGKSAIAQIFKDYQPSIDLRIGNDLKKQLTGIFCKILNLANTRIGTSLTSDIYLQFLEAIISRDYFWNFRDMADIAPADIRPKIIYRTSVLARYIPSEEFDKLVERSGLAAILDLRGSPHLSPYPYPELKNLKYYNVGVEPKEIPEPVIRYAPESIPHKFYELFPRYYHSELKAIFQTLISAPKPLAIHCHAGKDRTGIVIAMLHLLIGTSRMLIYRDYLSTRIDTTREKLDILMECIEEYGGIEPYFDVIGLSSKQIQQLKDLFSIS